MITNRWVNGTEGAQEAFGLRHAVFAEEMGISSWKDPDPLDSQAMQLIIYDGDEAVATGRLYHDGRSFCIGRLCVKQESRGQGIGDLLVKLLLLKAFAFSPSRVRVMAGPEAQGFYERYGFFVAGQAPGSGPQAGESGRPAPRSNGMGKGGEGIPLPPRVPMEVTKETLVFKSKCGHDKTFWDFFGEGKTE